MIDNFHGFVSLNCDYCDNSVDDFDDFYEVIEYKKDKSNGWTTKKEDGEWVDICPCCSKK